MQASVIIVLVGLPGAGKSTFSKLCKTYLTEYHVEVYHYDDLCVTFSTDERKSILNQAENYILHNKTPNVLIIDDNNYYKSMRFAYMKLCRKLHLGFMIVYFKMSLEDALERNARRNVKERIPNDIIKEMFGKLEVPTGEYVVNINISHDFCDFDLDFIRNKILNASKTPLCQVEAVISLPMPASLLQKVDLTLRKIVHRKILEDKTRARELNILKKDVYKKITSGELVVSAEFDEMESELAQYFV
ncbi:L-seryl-tRNA(Sec) kinase [Atheta coriaria]|uniref:L-seryl-tRNA(Sec) kinase n=1 Tax=Dalotia coriaria TaxID=877792 RepID=UPI0031F36E51